MIILRETFIASLTYDYRKLLSHRKIIVRFSCNQAPMQCSRYSSAHNIVYIVQLNVIAHLTSSFCNVDVCVCMRTEAFQQAKHRMIATRENLKSDFIRTLGGFVINESEA